MRQRFDKPILLAPFFRTVLHISYANRNSGKTLLSNMCVSHVSQSQLFRLKLLVLVLCNVPHGMFQINQNGTVTVKFTFLVPHGIVTISHTNPVSAQGVSLEPLSVGSKMSKRGLLPHNVSKPARFSILCSASDSEPLLSSSRARGKARHVCCQMRQAHQQEGSN